MRLFPGNLNARNAANTDKQVPPDNNPRNDSVHDGYADYPVHGVVFPYRGMEQHGVPAEQPWGPSNVDDAGYDEYANPSEHFVPDPIPVYVVRRDAAEVASWNAQQINVGINPREITGRNRSRTRVRLKNLHPSIVVYIGRANMASWLSGYPLDPNAQIEMNTTDEIWGVTADPAGSPIVSVLQEFTVSGEGISNGSGPNQ